MFSFPHQEYVVPRSIPMTVPTSSFSPLSAAGTRCRHEASKERSNNLMFVERGFQDTICSPVTLLCFGERAAILFTKPLLPISRERCRWNDFIGQRQPLSPTHIYGGCVSLVRIVRFVEKADWAKRHIPGKIKMMQMSTCVLKSRRGRGRPA